MIYKENYSIWVSHKYKLVWKHVGAFLLSQSEFKSKKANPRDHRHKLMRETQLISWRQPCLDNSSNENGRMTVTEMGSSKPQAAYENSLDTENP